MNPVDKLILALDVPTLEKALNWIDALKHQIKCFKIGTQLFIRGGPDIIKYIKDHGAEVFLDLKLHDIPNTVVKSAAAANSIGADYLTIHASVGSAVIADAVAAAPDVKILVVTALTSQPFDKIEVRRNSSIARQAGAAGCICPGSCLNDVFIRFPEALKFVPGIRLAGEDPHDQVNVMTPYSAIFFGADRLVIGRPILQSADPSVLITKFLDEIKEGMNARKNRK